MADYVPDELSMCDCQQYAVSRVVKKPGPTLGERFWTCPVGKDKGGCTFFRWENPANYAKAKGTHQTPANTPSSSTTTPSPPKRQRLEDDAAAGVPTDFIHPETKALTNTGLLKLTTVSLSADEQAALPLLLSILHKLMGQNE